VDDSDLSRALTALASLAESANGLGQVNVATCAYASLLMLLDGAMEDGVQVDTEALGFMVGFVDD
jgi:hypothetical protein